MALTGRNAAAVRQGDEDAADLIASESSLWPPRTVVKAHRKKATFIWVSLLAAFFVYVGYIVWDTVDARKNPAASVQLKQSPFTFPDVAVCATFLNGCLSENYNCLEDWDFTLLAQTGFMDDTDDFVPADYPGVTKFKDAFPQCAVMPLSKLTVNETGVDNGDIDYFWASFSLIWPEDPLNDYNATENGIFTQYVSAHFIDVEEDVDELDGTVVDVKLPYERIYATPESWFTATRNHVVLRMTEFSGITENGNRKERERTYSQSTTSAPQNWYWGNNSTVSGLSLLQIEMLITKFEYTTVEEVDPVDLWAIVGAIGGVWQFVVVAFGVFFIFSEKQPPDKKMRSFYDTVVTPAVTINRRLSSMTSSSSSVAPDIEIDATDDDLPPGWVKKQRKSGIVYYYQTMTGATSVSAPHEMEGPISSTDMIAAPRRQAGMRALFRGAYKSQRSLRSGLQDVSSGTNAGESLPPGWVARQDGDGKHYYFDSVSKVTQWNRPAWRVHSASSSVLAVDTPMRRTRRDSSTSSSQDPAPATIVPPITTTAATGGVVGHQLPPNWNICATEDGKSCFANSVTKKTQWDTPV